MNTTNNDRTTTPRRSELAICGMEAVRALADARPDAVRRLFFSEEAAPAFGSLCSHLATQKRLYRIAESAELERLSGSIHHQGVVAMIHDDKLQTLTSDVIQAWAAENARVLLLDRVGDDHNLGSIARSAAFFGYSAIILTKTEGSAKLSTSAYRVARGGLERLQVYIEDSAQACIKRCKGLLTSAGADHRGGIDLRDFKAKHGTGNLPPVIIPNENPRGSGHARTGEPEIAPSPSSRGILVVFGNEETGLSAGARASCDYLIRICGIGSVESLNVSQAATVFLYELAPTAWTAQPSFSSPPDNESHVSQGDFPKAFRPSGQSRPTDSNKRPRPQHDSRNPLRTPSGTPGKPRFTRPDRK